MQGRLAQAIQTGTIPFTCNTSTGGIKQSPECIRQCDLEITPIAHLVLRSSIGVDYSNTLSKNIEPAFQEGFLGRDVNSLALQQGNDLTLTWTNTANYQLELDKHRFTFLAGTEAIRQDFQGFGAFREGFAVEDENYYVLNAGTGRSTNNGSATAIAYFPCSVKSTMPFLINTWLRLPYGAMALRVSVC